MKKRFLVWGCLLAALVLVVVAGGAAWWFFRSQRSLGKPPPGSPLQVYILTPSSGDEVHAGDPVEVTLSAQATTAISSAELFVDGASQGISNDMPEHAWWTWHAWPAGIHTLSARAIDSEGHTGLSQTVLLNVLAPGAAIQVPAADGQTLAQIGAAYGVPPDQMAGSNPHVDANQPLQNGQPINVPTGGGGSGTPPQPPGGSAGSGGTPPGGGNGLGSVITIVWDFKLTKPADKSYCYISTGNGVWDKLPHQPFDFFSGLENLYTQLIDTALQPNTVLQADCWGWLGGALQYLGQGQTQFDSSQPLVPLTIDGNGFQLIGTPQFPPGNSPQAYSILPQIEPPYALREPASSFDCLGHGGGTFECSTALGAPVKSSIVLEWEWQPGLHWPNDPAWITSITGYDVFEIDPINNQQQLMREVTAPGWRVVALPLPWGARCYGVQAYADAPEYGGKITSKMAQYCPGQPPALQEMTFTPSAWTTEDNVWFDLGSCHTNNYFTDLSSFVDTSAPNVLVGSWIQEGSDCDLRQGDYKGGFRFKPLSLPNGAVFQKAILKLSVPYKEYGAEHVALPPAPPSCAAGVGIATQDWSAQNVPPRVFRGPIFTPGWPSPFAGIGYGSQADVTPVVAGWLAHPSDNYGLFLTGVPAPKPLDVGDYGSGLCLSWVRPTLEVYFFAP